MSATHAAIRAARKLLDHPGFRAVRDQARNEKQLREAAEIVAQLFEAEYLRPHTSDLREQMREAIAIVRSGVADATSIEAEMTLREGHPRSDNDSYFVRLSAPSAAYAGACSYTSLRDAAERAVEDHAAHVEIDRIRAKVRSDREGPL